MTPRFLWIFAIVCLGCGPSISIQREGSTLTVRADANLDEKKPPPVRDKTKVSGFCKKKDIIAAVNAGSGKIKTCYEKALTHDRTLAGRVNTLWRVGFSGRVLFARAKTVKLRNEDVLECMCREILTWKFPKPQGGQCQIKYPFVFSAAP